MKKRGPKELHGEVGKEKKQTVPAVTDLCSVKKKGRKEKQPQNQKLGGWWKILKIKKPTEGLTQPLHDKDIRNVGEKPTLRRVNAAKGKKSCVETKKRC